MRNVLIGFVFTMGCSPSFNSKGGMVDTTTIDPNAEGGWPSCYGVGVSHERDGHRLL